MERYRMYAGKILAPIPSKGSAPQHHWRFAMDTKTKGILSYILIAFGLSWIIWEIPAQKGLSLTDPVFGYMILLGSFGPAAACIVVRKWVTREGFSDAGLRLQVKKWRVYLIAWFLPLVVALSIVGVAVLLGVGDPDFSPHAVDARVPVIQLPPLPSGVQFVFVVATFMISAAIMAPLLWGEEFGWRSYLQIRLFSDNPVKAAVATGLIWGVWHYPINLRGYNYPDHPILGLLLFPLSTVCLSILIGWVRTRSGSIWPACLAHSGVGIIGSSLVAYLFMRPDSISRFHLEVVTWIPLVVLCAWVVLTGRLNPE
jgi:membrane protease YdiL (CAAX protease family)